MLILLVLLVVAALHMAQRTAASPAASPLRVSVMVPHAAKQASAGVFRRSDGALVRTLWHNNTGIPPRTRLEVT